MADGTLEMMLKQARETKNTIMYEQEQGGENPINLYLKKTDLEAIGTPERIKAVVTPA